MIVKLSQLLVVLMIFWALPIFGGEPQEITLVKHSRYQPAFAVWIGDEVYFSDAVNLEGEPKDCPAKHLYRVNLKDQTESRVLEIDCVVKIHSGDSVAFIEGKGKDGELLLWKLFANSEPVPLPGERIKAAKSLVAFRRTKNKEKRVDLKTSGVILRKQELNLILTGGGNLYFVPLLFSVGASKDFLSLPQKIDSWSEMVVTQEEKFFSFDHSTDRAWGEVSVFSQTGNPLTLGVNKALPKQWQKVAEGEWSVRSPRYLLADGNDVILADRTNEVFSEAPAISKLEMATKTWVRIPVEGNDVGGLSLARSGIVVSRPLTGAVTWFGIGNPLAEIKNEK